MTCGSGARHLRGRCTAARLDLSSRRDRLKDFLAQVEAARDLYRQGNAVPLRILYDYWREVAGNDIRGQVRCASDR
jgi:hypothetical protein